MKSLKKKSRLLVEQILEEKFLDANSTLTSLITEAEENREEAVDDSLGGDEVGGDENIEGGEEAEGGEEQVNTDGIEADEPTDGGPALGDSLDQSVEDTEDQAVGEGEMTEMSNDVVEINCEINQKIISILYDKISNLKTALNAKDLDHDTREFITLETKLAYYGNKLEELQSKTNPAINQNEVEKRVDIIDAALKSLETEIGGSDEVSDVESSDELSADEGTEEGTEGGDEAPEEGTEGEEGAEGAEEGTEGEEGAEGAEEGTEGEEEGAQ